MLSLLSRPILLLLCSLPLCVLALSSIQTPIPITILSGFLGTGKTTLLQNMLQNKEGMKIAVVVNDVASVNIDSKLVARDSTTPNAADTGKSSSDGMVELQNGCACCSLSDELLTSVSELVTMSDLRADEERFQHIVIELSGVADPKAVRANFQEAVFEGMPLMERVQLDTMVTLVDASMFQSHFESTKSASRKEMPELFFSDGVYVEEVEEEEWMKDLPPILLEAVMAGFSAKSKRDEENSVANLLVSQTETADLVVLNKVDLVDDAQLNQLKEIVAALNPRAKVVTTTYGQLPIKSVLAIAGGQGVAVAGAVDDHRDYVTAAIISGEDIVVPDKTIELMTADCTEPDCTDPMHSHSHVAHDHDCAEPDCTDASHSHAAHAHDCAEPDCTDASHSHAHTQDCAEPDCTDSSHSHAHNDNSCEDPGCTDSSHSHSHSHSSHDAALTTQQHAGIGTFVYKARRPFHPGRLVSFLHNLPVVRGIPESMDEEQANNNRVHVSDDAKETLKSCLRSKGFIWCADSHTSAMFWSQAGASFELSCLGSWWATLPRNQWPTDVNDYVLQDFDNVEHCDATNPVGVGDRRQEVVFIGQRFGSADCQMQIRDTLNQCLLDDKEYEDYKSIQSEESQLQTRFANLMETKLATY